MTDHKETRSMQKRVTISVVAQVISQLLMGILGVVILKVMTNDLGTKDYGVYVTIFAFVSTFALLTDLGVNSITAREVAKHPEDAAHIIGHNMGLRICLSLIMIPIIFGLSFVFYPNSPDQLHAGILLMSFYLIFDVVWAASGGYFAAKVRNDINARVNLLQQLLFLIGVCLTAALGWKLFGYITVFVISVAISAFVLLYLARKYVAIRPRMNMKVWRTVIKTSVALGIISIINAIYLKADSVMLSIISGATAVGIYGVAYLLVNVFASLPTYIMTALTPSMATAKKKDLSKIVQKAFHFMIVFSVILIVGGVLARKDVVLLVSSPEFLSAAAPFAILTLAIGFSYINSVFRFTSVAIDKHHKFVFLSLFALGLNIVLNLFFIPAYGVVGAAWATVISEFTSMTIGYRLFHSQTGLSLETKVVIRPILVGMLSFVFGWLGLKLFGTNVPIVNCLIIGLTITLPYFGLLYATDGLPIEIKNVLKKVTLNVWRLFLPRSNR